jgi:hypothetical protein
MTITWKTDSSLGIGASALRIERPGRRLGDLVKPGMVIQEHPGQRSYLIDRVTPCEFGWSLSGFYLVDGGARRDENDRWWLTQWVAQDYAPAMLGVILRPIEIYDYDCPAYHFAFYVVAEQAFAVRRSGQLEMFA